jgi:predicted transcriptional regulator
LPEDLGVENPLSPTAVLSNLMREKGISFDDVKRRLIKDKLDKADEMTSLAEIPKPKIFELIDRIKKTPGK